MNHTRGQFIAIWVIFGVTVFFAMQQYALLLKELSVSAGIYLDVNPSVLKYSQAISYGILWLVIIVVLMRIIAGKSGVSGEVNYRRVRLALIIFVITGALSQVAIYYLGKARRSVLREYLHRHDSSMVEYLNQSTMMMFLPLALILATIVIAFFILTRNERSE